MYWRCIGDMMCEYISVIMPKHERKLKEMKSSYTSKSFLSRTQKISSKGIATQRTSSIDQIQSLNSNRLMKPVMVKT